MQADKITFKMIDWNKMPLLKTMVLVQSSIILLFSIFTGLISYNLWIQRNENILSAKKMDIVRMMSSQQEKIRVLKSLGMNEAVDVSLKDSRKISDVKSIEVLKISPQDFEKIKSKDSVLLIPGNYDKETPYFLLIKIQIENSTGKMLGFFIVGIVFFIFSITYFSMNYVLKKFLYPLSLLVSDNDMIKKDDLIEARGEGEIGVLIGKVRDYHLKEISLESEKVNYRIANQLAHDIRSPLGILKSIRPELNSFSEANKAKALLSIHRIDEIVDSLLVSRKSRTNNKFKSVVDIGDIVDTIVLEKKVEYEEYDKLDIKWLASRSEKFFAYGDRVVLKGIISNLINNSVEAMPNHKGSVTLSLVCDEKYCKIIVKDNGSGISNDLKDRILHEEVTSKANGNGIGLLNARLDLEKMDGDIKLFSSSSEGTEFHIKLKVYSQIEKYDKIIPKMIVLIDDDRLVRINWTYFCRDRSIPIKCFTSVESFLNESTDFDLESLIFIDSNLKDEDRGEIEAEKIYKKGFKYLYVVTGYQKDDIVKPKWIRSVFAKEPSCILDLIL